MKKFLVIAIASVAFVSCSKDYKCECNDPSDGQLNELAFRTTSNSHATRLCDDWRQRQQSAVPDKGDILCKIK